MAFAQWTRSMEWLAAASEDPRACKEEWQNGSTGVTLLAAGRFWDVLVVPEDLGLRVAELLEELPLLNPGPCLLDARRRHVGFLLPPEPHAVWIGTGLRLLGRGTWIAAPAPHCRWGALRWLVPPDGTGTLTMPEVLEVALQRCASELSRLQGNPAPLTDSQLTPAEFPGDGPLVPSPRPAESETFRSPQRAEMRRLYGDRSPVVPPRRRPTIRQDRPAVPARSEHQ
ncbi:hypothetical protein ACIHFB_01890 [Streptomyces sp. NPDC051963]|uniref:hypothetical protein n=1 Tax=Streptomyces sp. NPDC051963 TaxID=3365678 RepID=UPI0037D5E18D